MYPICAAVAYALLEGGKRGEQKDFLLSRNRVHQLTHSSTSTPLKRPAGASASTLGGSTEEAGTSAKGIDAPSRRWRDHRGDWRASSTHRVTWGGGEGEGGGTQKQLTWPIYIFFSCATDMFYICVK